MQKYSLYLAIFHVLVLVLFPMDNKFKASLPLGKKELVVGLTKLRSEIYILCRTVASETVFRVFHDLYPFKFQKEINVESVTFPEDVISSKKENCLYVIDTGSHCIWKIIRELDDTYQVKKWLSIDIDWSTVLSVTRDENLLIVRGSGPLSRLEIYGKNATRLLSIRLPPDIQFPQQAVETSTGNFIILHERVDETGASATYNWLLWEVTRDGKNVNRRYIPQNVEQELNTPRHLSIDLDDRVLVADTRKGRLLLLDCGLRWNRIPIHKRNHPPLRLCYDEAQMQLIVTFELKGLRPRIYDFNSHGVDRRLR